MIDSKTVVREVQKELLAAVQRGHEQVRKGQDRVRQRQQQVRKSGEAVAGVVSKLAKSVRPGMPTVPTARIPNPAEVRAHAQELASHAFAARHDLADRARHAATPYAERVKTAQRDLTEKARHSVPYAERIIAVQRDLAERARHAGLADQVAAAQRTVAGRVIEAARVATPLVAEGRARLGHMFGVPSENGQTDLAADGPDEAVAATEVVTPQAAATTAEPAPTTLKAAEAATPSAQASPEAQATPTAKASTAKASTAKASTAKASTAKASTAKASTAKASTADADQPASTSKSRNQKK
jgi:ribonuclease R